MYTKRKLSKQGASCSGVDSSTDVPLKLKVKFPQAGWGSRLDKMPLFTKAEMNNYIENSGKRLGSSHHSVPTSCKKGKTFLEEESTEDLVNDADQNPEEACTSRLQTWHRKGRGDTIVPQPVMDVIVKKTKLSDTEKQEEGINCLLYEARNNVTVLEAEERTFKETLRKINPKMGLANVSSRHGE